MWCFIFWGYGFMGFLRRVDSCFLMWQIGYKIMQMKKLIIILQNIWKIKELCNCIFFILGMFFVFCFGFYIVLLGVIFEVFDNVIQNNNLLNDLFGLINVFIGGVFNNVVIFVLGIMFYIMVFIIIQLLGFVVFYFQCFQWKEGELGCKKFNQIICLFIVVIILVQGGGYLIYINSFGVVDLIILFSIFWIFNIIIFFIGIVFFMWLGEWIIDWGIGNGIFLLIIIGIIVILFQVLVFEFQFQLENNGLIIFVLEMVVFFGIVMVIVLIVQGVCCILI